MIQQTLEFFSGFPALLSPNAPAILRKAKLDGRRSDEYLDRRGRHVEVSGLSRDYHVYVLASRLAIVFGSNARWDPQTRSVSTSVLFQTSPQPREVSVKLVFDGSSPYKTPAKLRLADIVDVAVESPAQGGLPLGMTFIHNDGERVGFMLSPDLLHYLRFAPGHEELTDFKVEYIGVACGPNGNSDVFRRAEAHEKVVEIQGDFQQRHGNRQLFIFAYDPGYVVHARAGSAMIVTGSSLVPKLVDGGENTLFEAMEASLIAYFQPEYNVHFKNFPRERPIWLDGHMRSLNGMVLRISRVCVTLASDSSFNPQGTWTFGRLRSEGVAPRDLHVVEVDIPSIRPWT